MTQALQQSPAAGSASEVFLAFLKLGVMSFGGPIAHLGYFRRELVERRAWLNESQFTELLVICQFLPGPASSQLGFSLGLIRAGWFGAMAAFLAFTLPSAFLLVAFAAALPLLSGDVGQAAVHGLKIVACVVVADAVLGMAKKLCPDAKRGTIAAVGCSVLLVSSGPWAQLLVVAGGAVAGLTVCRVASVGSTMQSGVRYGTGVGIMLLLSFLILLFGLPVLASQDAGLLPVADAFYQAGALVFGGGHVVLPLLEDSVVSPGWVTSETFLAGYGAAQAVPGPMFAISAYLGAVIPTGQSAWLGASVALLFMFLPGFLLVAGILPFWHAISHHQATANMVAGVNAAVVGLLGAALYDPVFTSAIHVGADLAIAIVAFAFLSVWRLSALVAVGWCVAASVFRVFV